MDTKYSGYSLNQLHALFSTEQWNSLSFSDRLSACQEVENRYAAENNVEPCTVTFQPMEGKRYGWQNGDRITLNSHLLSDGQFVTHGVQHEARVGVLAPGWNTLDTVYHEGTHGIQEKTGNMPDTYINPDMDQDLYRIQGIEKQAFAQGQLRTLEAMQTYEKESGKLDPDHDDYLASVRNDSFQSALADAAKHYNDPNIEKTVNDVIHDRDAGIVRENPSASYKAVNDLCDSYGIGASRSSYQASENSNAAQNANEAQNNNASQNTQQTGNTQTNEAVQNSSENNAGAKESSDEKSSGETMDDGLNSSSSSKESSEDNSTMMNSSSVSLSGSMDDGAGNALSSGMESSAMDDGLGNDPASSAGESEMDDGLGESGAQEEGSTQEADDGLGNDGNDNDGGEDSSLGGMDND